MAAEGKGTVSTPYIGFGNDTLERQPEVRIGSRIRCPKCKRFHKLMPFHKSWNGVEPAPLAFYLCKKQPYLGAVNGRLIAGLKPDVSGEV